ncbi:MAG: homoserine dehydrogenase [Saccharofermentans sp.]|nr:homoserine dehydrogenase [Saccharofermentans sp.]
MAVNIAILGFGTVGSGVADILAMNRDSIKAKSGKDIVLKHVLDIVDFPDSPFADLVTHNADDVFEDPDLQVVIETIGGARIAYEYTKRALSKGISVVTSNKELVSTHGVELLKLAADNGCTYLYEAAVGGGIPIIQPLYRDLAANKIVRIAGIVNGTTNYILSAMKDEGISYEEALKQAQENGYAEADPTADVEGIDAQRKLSILSTIALEGNYVAPDDIHAEGISKLTLDDIDFEDKAQAELKLIAYFENKENGAIAYVAPTYVSRTNLLSSVNSVFNAVMVDGNALGVSMYYGQGAGTMPTASAVFGDILQVAVTGGKPLEPRLWKETSDKIAAYGDVKADILVRLDSKADELMKAFDGYAPVQLGEDAVMVDSISHADAEKICAGIDGSKWFHILR